MNTLQDTDTTPWYRQFWCWFLIALPSAAVIASVITVFIAVSDSDTLVSDDYYKDGLAINRTFARAEQAAQNNIHATLEQNGSTLNLRFSGVAPQTVELNWLHPVSAKRDQSLSIALTGNSIQLDTQHLKSGKWYLEITGQQPEQWRLSSALQWPLSKPVNLMPFGHEQPR